MGFVDRGGGRESKGNSLRRSKKNPGCATAKAKTQVRLETNAPLVPHPPVQPKLLPPLSYATRCNLSPDDATRALANPFAAPEAAGAWKDALSTYSSSFCPFFDCCVSVLSRKFDSDRERLLERAQNESGVGGMLCWSNVLLKQESLVQACGDHTSLFLATSSGATPPLPFCDDATRKGASKKKSVKFAGEEEEDAMESHADPSGLGDYLGVGSSSTVTGSAEGRYYCLVGIHPNNVDRTNKKQHEDDLKTVSSLALYSQSVGILAGYNMNREPGTFFAQETVFRDMWALAGRLQKPLVLFLINNYATATDEDGTGDSEIHPKDRETVAHVAGLLSELIEESEMPPGVANALEGVDETGDGAKHTAAAASSGTGKGATTTKKAANPSTDANADDGKLIMPPSIVLHSGLAALSCSTAMQDLVKKYRPASTQGDGTHQNAVTGPVFYVMTSAEGLSVEESGSDAKSAVSDEFSTILRECVAPQQLLICTDAPRHTPQNIEDEYIRTMPNEPANYMSVLRLVHAHMRALSASACPENTPATPQELGWLSRENAFQCFFPMLLAEARLPVVDSPDQTEEEEGETEPETADTAKPVDEKGASRAPATAPPSVETYSCFMCRAPVFPAAAVATHPENAAVVQFKDTSSGKKKGSKKKNNAAKGGEAQKNACDSTVFVDVFAATAPLGLLFGKENADAWIARVGSLYKSISSGEGDAHASGGGNTTHVDAAVLHGDGELAVYCAGCQSKLGSLACDSACPCGAVVPGVTARITASRVDAVDAGLLQGDDAEVLEHILARAAKEREEQEEEGDDESDDDDDDGKKKRRNKVNVKANNRSNFTHFRNKNFVPGLKGKATAAEKDFDGRGEENDDDEEEVVYKPNNKKKNKNKGRKGRRDDEDDDDGVVDPLADAAHENRETQQSATVAPSSSSKKKNKHGGGAGGGGGDNRGSAAASNAVKHATDLSEGSSSEEESESSEEDAENGGTLGSGFGGPQRPAFITGSGKNKRKHK